MGHNLQFGNFICKFGEKDLLDYAYDIVLPAFTDDTLIRTVQKETEFFFYEVEVVKLDDGDDKNPPTLAITGHYIKSTVLKRTQIFSEDKGLVPDFDAIASAPSAYFALILNNHKLLYLPMTPHAPDMKSFGATAHNFLRIKHKDFLEQTYEQLNARGERTSKKAVAATHQKPKVRVMPLASRSSVEDFVRQFKTLRSMELKILNTNQEMSAKKMWEKMRSQKNEVGSDETTVRHSHKKGLKKDVAVTHIHDAASAGNQEVKLVGIDTDGNKLRGNNHNFSYTAPIEELPEKRSELNKVMFSHFTDLVQSGTIVLDQAVGNAANAIRRIKDLLDQ